MLFGIERKAGLLPGLETYEKRMDVFVTVGGKFLGDFGAGCFMGTSAIRDHGSIVTYFGKVLLDLCGRHPHGVRQLRVSLSPGLSIARVHEGEFFAAIHSRLYFVNRHSRDFHSFHRLASTSHVEELT
jgi:hypothetical protein